MSSWVAAAPAIEVVEAVLPAWPATQPRDVRGHVDIEFTLLGRQQSEVHSTATDLPAPFSAEAVEAFEAWLLEQPAGSGCGMVRGRARFVFDGAADEESTVDGIDVLSRPEGAALPMLDRVEVNAGRVRRSKLADRDALATEPTGKAAAERSRQARWSALGRASAAYLPPGFKSTPSVKVWIEPGYPREALQNGIDGDVALVIEIDDKGKVVDAEVAGATLPRLFNSAALAAVRRWQLRPAYDAAGKAAPARACQIISFRLGTSG